MDIGARRPQVRIGFLIALFASLAIHSAESVARPAAPPAPAAPASVAEKTTPPASAEEPADEESDSADSDTPRRALERFLGNARAGDLTQAADDLFQISNDSEEMEQLARKLQEVIDRQLPFDKERLAKISDLPAGSKDSAGVRFEEIGRIEMRFGNTEPVRLQRVRHAGGSMHWRFSRGTVMRINAWYRRLDDHFLLDLLPGPLLITGPGGLLYWQWLALPWLLALSAAFGVCFSWVLRLLGKTFFAQRELFAAVLERQMGPLRLVGAALGLRVLLLTLFITALAEQAVRGLCNIVLIAGIMFSLWRIADVLTGRMRHSAWLHSRPSLGGMMPLLQRLVELGLWSVAVLWSLQELGYSVTAVLASLGLGGLAVALAAKNTLEHLLGGMTLSLDQPMRVGDLVKVGDVQGYVEEIGIRSTRIRTVDRSLVTIPNGKLADMHIETLAARDRLRMALTLNIGFALRPPGLRQLREELLNKIQEQPLVLKDKVRVHYSGLQEHFITVEVVCWFATADSDQFAEARHNLLLALLEIIESKGAQTTVNKPASPQNK